MHHVRLNSKRRSPYLAPCTDHGVESLCLWVKPQMLQMQPQWDLKEECITLLGHAC